PASDGRPAPRGEPEDGAVSGFSDRHAGAVHGARVRGRWRRHDRGDDLREPIHARTGAAAIGRRYRDRRQHGSGAGRAEAFGRAGIMPLEDPDATRSLIIATSIQDLRLVVVRATDVPTYVQYGAAELGMAGKDVLLEHGGAGLYQPLELGIGRCRLCVAVPDGFDYAGAVRRGARLRVATKYVQTAREFFAGKGVHVDLIR